MPKYKLDCSVKGCIAHSDGSPQGSEDVNLCDYHAEVWGYYRAAYYEARGKEADGLLHKKLWEEAMAKFLVHSAEEIEGEKAFAEAVSGEQQTGGSGPGVEKSP